LTTQSTRRLHQTIQARMTLEQGTLHYSLQDDWYIKMKLDEKSKDE
jgi:hypothetical protein